MKKTTNVFLALCVVLCVLAFSCASGGGAKGAADLGPGIPVVGVWEGVDDSSDGGVSTIVATELEIDGKPAYNYKGNVPKEGTAIDWPWVQVEVTPDEASLEALKKAKGISFMVKGNGAGYAVRYQINSVQDWAWHSYSFTAPATETRITVTMNKFMQPSWGVYKRLTQDRFTLLSFVPEGYGIDYDVTIWDLQVHE